MKLGKLRWWVVSLLIILPACMSVDYYPPNIRPAAETGQVKTGERVAYAITPNDVLEVFIYRNPDLSRDVIVGPDGNISLTYIGEVKAEGQSISQLKGELTKKYSEYLVTPDISVAVKKFAGQKVFVLGEVAHPGVYTFVGDTSLVEVLALAGSWTEAAKLNSVFIVRGDITGKPEVIRVDLNEIMHGNTRHNVVIYPKDIVYIPSTFIADVGLFVRDYLGPIQTTLLTFVSVDYLRNSNKK